jgi:hypothetical protein
MKCTSVLAAFILITSMMPTGVTKAQSPQPDAYVWSRCVILLKDGGSIALPNVSAQPLCGRRTAEACTGGLWSHIYWDSNGRYVTASEGGNWIRQCSTRGLSDVVVSPPPPPLPPPPDIVRESDGNPPGSYRDSCNVLGWSGPLFSANCLRRGATRFCAGRTCLSGSYNGATIDMRTCPAGPIHNDDGVLRCGR